MAVSSKARAAEPQPKVNRASLTVEPEIDFDRTDCRLILSGALPPNPRQGTKVPSHPPLGEPVRIRSAGCGLGLRVVIWLAISPSTGGRFLRTGGASPKGLR